MCVPLKLHGSLNLPFGLLICSMIILWCWAVAATNILWCTMWLSWDVPLVRCIKCILTCNIFSFSGHSPVISQGASASALEKHIDYQGNMALEIRGHSVKGNSVQPSPGWRRGRMHGWKGWLGQGPGRWLQEVQHWEREKVGWLPHCHPASPLTCKAGELLRLSCILGWICKLCGVLETWSVNSP